MYSACVVLFCYLCRVCLYHIFLHYLINSTNIGQKGMEYRMYVSIFFYNFCETIFILKKIEYHISINVHMSSCKVLVILSDFNET